VTGAELLRLLRRLGRLRGLSVTVVREHGKGSHATLYFGERFTILRDAKDELKTGTLHAMLRQLGITLEDLRR
jgi:mRNA interferase HicA